MRAIRLLPLLLIPLTILAMAESAIAQTLTSADCLECHAEPDPDVPLVTDADLVGSTHEDFDCNDCHVNIEDLPHEDVLPPVNCGECHEEEDGAYSKHGRAARGVDPDIPSCADCHGSHDILSSTDTDSATHMRHLHTTCGVCHEDVDLAKKHDIKIKHPVEVYESSVHGAAMLEGKLNSAATCHDCHSTDGTAHRIYGPGDPLSTINHFNIPKTCGKCHDGIEDEYWEGIHGQLAARGETDTPVCTHCHGEHGILRTDDPRARVSSTHVAEATCAPCHESAFLNEKYGLPAGRLASFVDSYHGVKSRAGDATVANCASCHGGHLILSSTDPRSSIHLDNLQETCGSCHPRITTALATTKIHEIGAGQKTGIARLVTQIYLIIIVLIIGFMLFYTTIDFIKQSRAVRKPPQVRRMSANAVSQHTALAVSFTLLVLTGFALRFSDAGPFRFIFGWDGGAQTRALMHRGSAILFTFGCLWHTLYVLTRPGRAFVRDMWPRIKDGTQMFDMIRFNLGKKRSAPKFGRFGFVEKLEYGALIWGSVVMFISGVFLWFDNYAVDYVPKGVLDVMLVIHFYEAILATLAIAIWHLYSAVFNPQVYPGNPSWITGTMPERMYLHEHAADENPPPVEVEYGEDGEDGD